MSRTVTCCSTTAPSRVAGSGARSTRPSSNMSGASRAGLLSEIVEGSSVCSAPSGVITRARISGRAWCQGSHPSSTVDQLSWALAVRIR